MAEADERNGSATGNGRGGGEERNGADDRSLRAPEVIREASRLIHELTGHVAESVTELRRYDGEWHLVLEVLELERVPSSTDILGSYEVCLDGDGELIEYRRTGRHVRSQTDG